MPDLEAQARFNLTRLLEFRRFISNDRRTRQLITLNTERLILRPFAESDLDVYAEMCADPEVMRFLGGKTWTRMESWRHIAATLGHWQLRGYGPWAVETRGGGEMVGRVGFINPDGWPGFELGWTLARPAWGNGYATEAARRALEWAFTELDKDHVISLIHPDNKGSLAVSQRLGEKFERTVELLGEEVGVYGIYRLEWQGEE